MKLNKFTVICIALTIFFTAGCGNFANDKVLGSGKINVPVYDIKAPANGKILGLISEKNERISKDQPLFAIEDNKTDTSVKDISLQLALAEAELKKLEQGTDTQVPAEDLQSAQSNFYQAQQKANKMNNLLAQGAVSRNQAQAAQKELERATIRLQLASQLVITKTPANPQSIATQKQRIEELKKQKQNNLQQQQANEALSPCTGIITNIQASNNTVAKKGAIILQIQATETGTITLTVSQKQSANLKVGQKVLIKTGEEQFAGNISNITGTTVTIITTHKPENIKDGTEVKVILA